MFGVVYDVFDVAGLDNVATVHDHDVVCNLVRGCEVVRDVEDGDAEVMVKGPQGFEDCRPQRCVDHRHRFVGDDHLRFKKERSGDHYALTLPATELVRVAAEGFGGTQTDAGDRFFDQMAGFVS